MSTVQPTPMEDSSCVEACADDAAATGDGHMIHAQSSPTQATKDEPGDTKQTEIASQIDTRASAHESTTENDDAELSATGHADSNSAAAEIPVRDHPPTVETTTKHKPIIDTKVPSHR